MTEPRTHPYGVAIPPNPGDANWATGTPTAVTCSRCGGRVSSAVLPVGGPLVVRAFVECPECVEPARYDPPQEPQAPASGPDRGPRASSNTETAGGDVEARLVAALIDAGFLREDARDATDALLPLVVAYGDERADEARVEEAVGCHEDTQRARTEGAAEALHEARVTAHASDSDVAAWLDGYIEAIEHFATCAECTATPADQARSERHHPATPSPRRGVVVNEPLWGIDRGKRHLVQIETFHEARTGRRAFSRCRPTFLLESFTDTEPELLESCQPCARCLKITQEEGGDHARADQLRSNP